MPDPLFPSLRLDGRRALIVGASSGIGYEVAREFHLQGADITILSETAEIATAAECLQALDGRAVTAIRCDITDTKALTDALSPHDSFDILVQNAGYERLTPLLAGPEADADFARVMAVNLNGSWAVTRLIAPKMPRGGRIIYTASTYSKYAISRNSAYAGSKHGLLGLMRSFAHDLGPRGITVNAICPGWVNTEFSNRSVRQVAAETGRSFDEVGDDVLRLQSLPGLLEPRDMVGGYLFLASDLARDVTGQTLHVDRGEYQD